MGYQENIRKDLLRLLNQRDVPAVEIINWQDSTRADGYCDSCYYEWAVVEVYYLDPEGVEHDYVYSGDFSDLIREFDSLNDGE